MTFLNGFALTNDLARAATLPARCYIDPHFLELEKEKIFWKTWQPVGRVDMVTRPGDYFTYDLVGEPLAELASPLPYGLVATTMPRAASISSNMRKPSRKRE